MGLLKKWREARGSVMRKELADTLARLRNANDEAKSGFYNEIAVNLEDLRQTYRVAAPNHRKGILKHCQRSARQLWDQGFWPQSLGIAIISLNIESEFVPGDDAAFVKKQTDLIIADA